MDSKNIEKLAYEWVAEKPEKVDTSSDFYCQTRDVFEARNDRMPEDLIKKGMDEPTAYLVYAMSGELGNNSFDHNIGSWPDIPGVFYTFSYDGKRGILAIADRGIGILQSLKNAVPDLKNDENALEIAFTKKISSRVLENRGNGLKFVKSNVLGKGFFLRLFSGNAQASINHGMEIISNDKPVKGCLVILKF